MKPLLRAFDTKTAEEGALFEICRFRRITRGDNEPYLNRWVLFRWPFGSIMLHHFLASDSPCLHDHPWFFFSVILWGGYWERCVNGYWAAASIGGKRIGEWRPFTSWHPPGSILYRAATNAHQIEVDGKNTWTLVLTGPPRRRWGFYTPKGWVHWKEYDYKKDCA